MYGGIVDETRMRQAGEPLNNDGQLGKKKYRTLWSQPLLAGIPPSQVPPLNRWHSQGLHDYVKLEVPRKHSTSGGKKTEV